MHPELKVLSYTSTSSQVIFEIHQVYVTNSLLNTEHNFFPLKERTSYDNCGSESQKQHSHCRVLFDYRAGSRIPGAALQYTQKSSSPLHILNTVSVTENQHNMIFLS